ncbi:hypothetical protein [Lactobacillus sp.]|uniref:hypothetical protein n=1 Tax=Lactobacillus sp. TaxID=1591 RepID=UPI003EF8AE28
MGFLLMLVSGIVGLALVILAFKKDLSKGQKWTFGIIGVLLVAFAIALALPNGLNL